MTDIVLEGKLTKFSLVLGDKSIGHAERMHLGIEGMEKHDLDTILFENVNYVIDVGEKVTVYINPDSKFNKNIKFIKGMWAYKLILPSGSELINEYFKM